MKDEYSTPPLELDPGTGREDDVEGGHPPMKKEPDPWAGEQPDETDETGMPSGTQAYWRRVVTKERMPISGKGTQEGQPTSDTARLPPPYAPPAEPMGRNVDVPAPMPGQTGGTKDVIKRPPPTGTLDEPKKPNFYFKRPPEESIVPGYKTVSADEGSDSDLDTSSLRHLGGHWSAINA